MEGKVGGMQALAMKREVLPQLVHNQAVAPRWPASKPLQLVPRFRCQHTATRASVCGVPHESRGKPARRHGSGGKMAESAKHFSAVCHSSGERGRCASCRMRECNLAGSPYHAGIRAGVDRAADAPPRRPRLRFLSRCNPDDVPSCASASQVEEGWRAGGALLQSCSQPSAASRREASGAEGTGRGSLGREARPSARREDPQRGVGAARRVGVGGVRAAATAAAAVVEAEGAAAALRRRQQQQQ